MDMFNLIAGAVSILAAAFALYVFLASKRKEAVETQKANEYRQRIADLLSMANAIAQQGSLLATLSDRDEVTKKELKHLVLSQLATVDSLLASLERTKAVEQRWSFGIPSDYLRIEAQSQGGSEG
jgi:hypothetical protein